MTNIIETDDGRAIGFYSDLVKAYKEAATDFLKQNDYERVEEMLEYIREIDNYTDDDGLLEVSNHNGMGFTCQPYNTAKDIITK